ncbi:hypothetical protein CGI23_25310 [Vibrio parahaemolyticus]|uniref:DUF2913 family protein n=1 Tax=Vibrio parahaemolyticus TaxID=670 RepID=UPI001122D2BC|nr:DUF2913 family protein [Vibrio parahaemolyticus]TOK17558.1 hypothetical protein CGI23_25310 [Vibrio parahaemolyticus]
MTTIRKDFDYYRNLDTLITHALLHLLTQISLSQRFVPVAKRNEILLKYLKPKLNNKDLSNIKKDIKLMIQTARTKGSNLEMKLYQLNEKATQTKIDGMEKLYSLLVYLYDEEGLESKLFEEGTKAEPGILYMLETHLEQGFDDNNGKQLSPVSILIQLERAPELIGVINRHGWFIAEMKEWNTKTHQAHILLHPSIK